MLRNLGINRKKLHKLQSCIRLTMLQATKNISMIWKSFLNGDKEAFASVYNLYVNDLYRYGSKLCKDEYLLKDAIQEVFLDLYLKRNNNKTSPENLKYYLLLALKRNLIKKMKQNRNLSGNSTDYDILFEPEYSVENTIIEQEEDEERKKRIQHVLNSLPAKQKEAVYLRYNEALEYPEIAKLLGVSVESVRKQVYRALKTIRELYKKQSIILWLYHSFKKSK